MHLVRSFVAASAVLAGMACVDGVEAQDTSPATVAMTPAAQRAATHPVRRRIVRRRLVQGRSAQVVPGVTGNPVAAPGADTAQVPGAGTARGASGTAGGISGAQRVGNIQGVSASPTTPTTLPPGTLDFGNGITTVANYTGEAAGNPYGGIKQGGRYADQFSLGVDIDLGKLAGSPGTSLHAIGTQRDGHSLTNDLIGNSVSVQEIYGGGQTYRLTYLSIEQKMLNDRVDVEIGRLPAQTAFLANPLYCNFQNNSICGSPDLVFADTNFTYYPAPTWGGTLKTKLTDKVFFNVGAYEVAPTSTSRTDHGVDFFANATGFFVPFELGYATTFDNDAYPRHYGVGAIIDRSPYNDAVLDTSGTDFINTGLPAATEFGRTAAYQRFDQLVWRPDPNSPRGLTLFGLAIEGTGGRQIQNYQAEFGLVDLGPFESRPYDTIDAFVGTQMYSDIGLANIRNERRLMGLSSDIASNETFFELNYGVQVSPAVRVMPNLQYILDPDQLRYPYRPKPIPDALVIGAKLSVDLFTLAGLAKGPGSI